AKSQYATRLGVRRLGQGRRKLGALEHGVVSRRFGSGPAEAGGEAGRKLLLARRRKLERGAIHAVAQAGRLGPIGEDVAEMGLAGGATHLGATHQPRAVVMLPHRLGIRRRGEARPARAGVEFRVGGEQRRATAHATIAPGPLLVPIRAGERALGTVLAGDMILLGRELLAPFSLALRHFRRALRVGHDFSIGPVLCRRHGWVCLRRQVIPGQSRLITGPLRGAKGWAGIYRKPARLYRTGRGLYLRRS